MNINSKLKKKAERKGSDNLINVLNNSILSNKILTKNSELNLNENNNYNEKSSNNKDTHQNQEATIHQNLEKTKTEKVLQNVLNLLGKIHQENLLLKRIMFKTKNQMDSHKHYQYMDELCKFLCKNILQNLHFHKSHISKIILKK